MQISVILNEMSNVREIEGRVLTRFGFTEDGSMLRSSLIIIEQGDGCEAATSKTAKGDVENGIH